MVIKMNYVKLWQYKNIWYTDTWKVGAKNLLAAQFFLQYSASTKIQLYFSYDSYDFLMSVCRGIMLYIYCSYN
jgi:hypothetical protein